MIRDIDQDMLDRESKVRDDSSSEDRRKPKFEILENGQDAMLNFGKFSGRTVRQLFSIEGGTDYLGWLYSCDGMDELKEVIEYAFNAHGMPE